jgi:type III secretion protein C
MLHINAKTEVKTELIDIGRLPSKQLTTRLNALGIADPRFPVRTTPNGGVVSVSGPPSYIALVRQTLTAMARASSAREDMQRVTIWRDLRPQQYNLPEDDQPDYAARKQTSGGLN